MIVSAIDGRIRCVEPELKKNSKADAIEKSMRMLEGVTSAKVSRHTGSLLIHYDNAVTSGRTIRRLINERLKQSGIGSGVHSLDRPPVRRYVKFGLLGTITGSIGFLLLSSEQWHYRVGTAFLALLLVHVFQNRRRILK